MPSPFPGMDPYLEDPAIWSGFHHTFLTAIQERLAPAVRPKYFVRVEERVYVSAEDDPAHHLIVPDVRIIKSRRRGSVAKPASPTAVAAPIPVAEPLEQVVHEYRLEVIDRIDRSVVTVIELLSPTNKVPNSAHWMEIDLLRDGARTANVPESGDAEYQVYLSRAGAARKSFVWPIYLQQRLPKIAILLRAGDEDVPLALQDSFEQVYEVGGYDLDINYGADPVPPLTPRQAQWARELLADMKPKPAR